MQDKNTSARLCAKNAGGGGGGLMHEGGRICGTLRYLPSLLSFLVHVLFGLPFLHLSFLMIFLSCFGTFFWSVML